MENQGEFLFADGAAPELHVPDPRSGFYEEVSALWQIPVGQFVHVNLTGHNLSHLQGRLDLARAPELPLDRREVLLLRISTIEFSLRQVSSWSLS